MLHSFLAQQRSRTPADTCVRRGHDCPHRSSLPTGWAHRQGSELRPVDLPARKQGSCDKKKGTLHDPCQETHCTGRLPGSVATGSCSEPHHRYMPSPCRRPTPPQKALQHSSPRSAAARNEAVTSSPSLVPRPYPCQPSRPPCHRAPLSSLFRRTRRLLLAQA